MFILKFILFLLLIGLVAVAAFLFSAWQRIREVFGLFSASADDRAASASDNDTVDDRRRRQGATQKIIPSDEGEYIDFEPVDPS